MKLYGNLNSPFTRICMVTAIECGLASKVQLKLVSLTPTKVDTDLEKLSPLAKVPTLETEPGSALFDSRVIMEYFCHVSGNVELLPREGNQRFVVLKLLALALGIGETALAIRYETTVRPADKFWPEFNERQNARLEACLVELETRWLHGFKNVDLGTIALACMLDYLDLRGLGEGWRKRHGQLSMWLNEITKRQSFQSTLPPG